ncbi:MAG: UDP-3-O-[3-hydroxymyristoyl] N-acetylglucosamine deacetylase [Candidatus Omnitrophica bacterium]|nr:UDP-3-O-[3-hydroxymyristoyl] N-acetylglucosamine deacetylase [Candidatus Omnitrophota bacterium]MCB9747598.1 UDP-3-O-[3-hydroxymyristoyl] N-acetylglucosamine deacetylase [Candidatus Omnitrophota bacterium]
MKESQKTIEKEFVLSGVGLHTGDKVNIRCKPAELDSGINFIRVDLNHKPQIKANPENIIFNEPLPRCTTIGKDDGVIHTVEHFMSALFGLGITNIMVEIDGRELPGLDGSGKEYVEALKKAGVKEQDGAVYPFELIEPIGVENNGSSIYMFPAKELKISYTLDYNHSFLKSQFFSSVIDSEVYQKQIAPCRTFCLESEANELKSKGLGKGANFSNTLVITENGVKENQMRFDDEFVRHKVLDFIGDLYLLGVPIRGHVFAVKSGHVLNIQLLKKIAKQLEKYKKKTTVEVVNISGNRVIGHDEIIKILPHRYPFLLVDKVIELEKGKRAIGIKNVTINESFFQGHFPTRAVMPGVLMVEAMAQTAGVVVLTNEIHKGKVAFFMAADKVKFRKVVTPGDQLVMEVEVVRDRSRTVQVKAQTKVGHDIVAEADMVFSYAGAEYLD